MSESDWTIPVDSKGYFREQKKTLDMEQRRPRVTKASDLLGPALGPFAIEIDNLDGDLGAFNGMWVAAPGTLESPDEDLWFAGYTIASEINGGYQYATTYLPTDAPHRAYERGWRVVPGTGTRAYSDWTQIGATESVFAEYTLESDQPLTTADIVKLDTGWTVVTASPAFTVSSANGSIICNRAGVYEVSVTVAVEAGTGATRLGYLYLNNVQRYLMLGYAPSTGVTARANGGRGFKLEVGDVLDVRAYQSSGGTLNAIAGVANQVVITGTTSD